MLDARVMMTNDTKTWPSIFTVNPVPTVSWVMFCPKKGLGVLEVTSTGEWAVGRSRPYLETSRRYNRRI